MMFDEIKQTLHDFGVDFDVYFHENNLHESGAVERAIERLDRDGQHLRGRTARCGCAPRSSVTTRTGCVVKSDGEGAYISGDLAYYLDKRERGFDRCLIMLGADHHGYVGRLMAHVRRVRRRAPG